MKRVYRNPTLQFARNYLLAGDGVSLTKEAVPASGGEKGGEAEFNFGSCLSNKTLIVCELTPF
jgi:hypothetical protein